MNSLAVRKYNIVKEMHTPGPTNCDTCDVTETDFDNINTHVKTHATNIQIQGELCNSVYKTSNNLGPLMENGTHRIIGQFLYRMLDEGKINQTLFMLSV